MCEKKELANKISQLNAEISSLESLLECLNNDEVIKSIHVERRTEVHEKRGVQHIFELENSEVLYLYRLIQDKVTARTEELLSMIHG